MFNNFQRSNHHDLEEDMIELTLYEGGDKIYIDFEGKGIPLDLPIIDISAFSPPEKKSVSPEDEEKLDELVSPEDDIIDEDDDELELIIDTEELKQNVKEIYINLDELTLEDEDLGEIEELEIVDETQKKIWNRQSSR